MAYVQNNVWKNAFSQHLIKLHGTQKHRRLPKSELVIGKAYVDFSSNDYLKLNNNPSLIQEAIEAGKKYGVGATGSRLLSGNNNIFEEFEEQIAIDKNTESALIFNSGFQTNITVLSSLLDAKILQYKPVVLFDKLNHASLYQAVFLSGAELIRYKHNDMSNLEELLVKYKNKHKIIVTETVFGMDGDIVDIHQIVKLAKAYNAFLYLDEAHATGVFGGDGYGISTLVDLGAVQYLIMGTFSKALGCSGGYIATDFVTRDYIINNAPGFIYSTANSPMVIGASAKSWGMISKLKKERLYLKDLGSYARDKLKQEGFNIGSSNSHIIPIIIGDEDSAIKAKDKLLQNGIIVSCIRPPTVPTNTSRIRIALNVSHTKENIDKLIEILKC